MPALLDRSFTCHQFFLESALSIGRGKICFSVSVLPKMRCVSLTILSSIAEEMHSPSVLYL